MAVRVGRQTPSKRFVKSYKTSLGAEAVELYNRSPKRKAQPWQENLLKDIMATGKNGLWVHQKFGYSVPRRNGKNEVIVMRELHGLERGEKMCHTAHRTTTSHSAWSRLCTVLDECGYKELGRKTKSESPGPHTYRTSKKYGLETIELTNGGSISFRTRTESGGLGEGFDLLVIDEAQEYTEAQQTALIYTVSDSKNPQTILLGTPPTMTSTGTVFQKMRDDAIKKQLYDAGWCEWGVDEEPTDIFNKNLWYSVNPSLGTILTPRKIQSEITSDRLDFIIQRLGYWYKYSLKSAITKDEWLSLACSEMPDIKGKLTVGIKHGKKLNNISMSIAVRTWDDRIFVEAIECRPVRDGYSWIIAFLRKADVSAIVIDGAAIQEELKKALDELRIKPTATLPRVSDVINAASAFEQMIADRQICHMGQASLVDSVSNCDHRPIGSSGGFGYISINDDIDISLLESAMLAAWARLKDDKPKNIQKSSY